MTNGERFSLRYSQRGQPTADSPRMRFRLGRLLDSIGDYHVTSLSRVAEQELGVRSPWSTGRSWADTLGAWELSDVLDVLTVAYRLISESSSLRWRWIGEVNRIFSETNVAYEMEANGSVRFKIDEEHARNVAATISALSADRYANVLHAVEEAVASLTEHTPNGKQSIRGMFAAAEGLFRLLLPKAPRLGAKEAEQLRPILQSAYTVDATASQAAQKMLSSFKEWIDAAHFYRHEPGKADEIAQPPLGLAVLLVSNGAAYVRWLAELDSAVNSK